MSELVTVPDGADGTGRAQHPTKEWSPQETLLHEAVLKTDSLQVR